MCNFASATRLSPSAARTRAISSFFLFLSPPFSPCFSRRAVRTVFFFTSFEMRYIFFNFASWFSFVLLSVEAIYYFNTVPTTSIDYVEIRYLFLSLFLSLSLSLSLALFFSPALAHCHSWTIFAVWTCRMTRQVLSFISATELCTRRNAHWRSKRQSRKKSFQSNILSLSAI